MKNKLLKVIAVLAALLIVARIVLFNVSAAMVGSAAMAGIIALIAAALVSSGQYTQIEVNNMNNNDIISSYRRGVENGTIDPRQQIELPNGATYDGSKFASVVDCYVNYQKYYCDLWSDSLTTGYDVIGNAVNNWLSDFMDDYENLSDYVIPSTTGELWPYPSLGYGALAVQKFVQPDNYGFTAFLYYCDYIVLDNGNYRCNFDDGPSTLIYRANKNGDIFYYTTGIGTWSLIDDRTSFYGDVRYLDGTQVNEQETEYVIGETEDGTKVTVDMLNPDGTVTIDGVTYDPSQYIDLDYFTDPAIVDLLQQILNAIENANVAAPDTTKDLVDSITDNITSDLDISEELTDYTIPTGIATVFPFCLPFDFVRGMKLMVAKPKVPVFKTELDLTDFFGYNLGKHKIEISLEKWEPAAVISRWFSLLMFSFTLILLTPKITKGAGA